MGEKFSLPIAQGLFVQLAKKQISPAEFLTQLFGEPGTHNYWLMCEGLVAYHNKDGGSPEVKHFDIVDSGFNTDTQTGFCKCSFGIHFHYTCSDVHNDAKDTIRWDFKVDEADSTIHFTGEVPWVRDAD